jgi:hypothetical protein
VPEKNMKNIMTHYTPGEGDESEYDYLTAD